MNKIENQKYVTSDSFKAKFPKRKYSTKCMPSNISLNLVSVSILPQNVNWSDMEGFVSRKYGPFGFNFSNANGKVIAGISFYVTYNCNGHFNSVGNYLAETTISPREIFVNPEYYFACNVTAGDPVNYGTKADPIAGVTLKVQMQVKSYHNLKLKPLYYSLENSIESMELPNSDEPVDEIVLINTNDSFSTNSYDTESLVDPKITYPCKSRLNVVEQYLNVIVRGDCQVHLISAYGY